MRAAGARSGEADLELHALDIAMGVVDGGAGGGEVGLDAVLGATGSEVFDLLEVREGIDVGGPGVGDCEVLGLVGRSVRNFIAAPSSRDRR